MLRLLPLVLFFAAQLCLAQSGILKMKDGTERPVKITATSSSSVFTSNGTFSYSSIAEAIFDTKEQRYQTVYDRLAANGISVSFPDPAESIAPEVVEEKPAPGPVPLQPQSNVVYTQTITMEDVVKGINEYQVQSSGGKGVMMFGAALLSTYFIMNAVTTEQNKKAKSPEDIKTVPMALPIAGAVILTIGISIDMSALKHLKIKR